MTALDAVLIFLLVLLLLRGALVITLAAAHVLRPRPVNAELPEVTVMIAAYNEEVGLERTVQSVLADPSAHVSVIVVDDGSRDATPRIGARLAAEDPRVTFITQPNGGKSSALNTALPYVTTEVVVSVDADSAIAPGTLGALAANFLDPKVGAAAGDVRVAGQAGWLSMFQHVEYVTGQHLDKRAQDMLGIITVVPGAAGAYRTSLLREIGGYSSDTLTEDMDLTIAIAERRYRVVFEPRAVGFTEPPLLLKHLWRQRLRWMYGTFQVMGKYRHLFLRPGAGRLGLLALPYVLVYGFMLGILAPLMDVVIIGYLVRGELDNVTRLALLNVVTDVSLATVALLLGRVRVWTALLTPAQRLFFRGFVAMVVIMTSLSFLRRRRVRWNKLPRVGLAGSDAAALSPLPVLDGNEKLVRVTIPEPLKEAQ